MTSRQNPPRSAKRKRPLAEQGMSDEYYDPNLKNPHSHVDRRLRVLSLEAYPVNVFGRVDDLVMFSAFASKGKKRRHHAVIPERSNGSTKALPEAEVGRKAATICRPIFGGGPASWDEAGKVALELQESIPEFQPESREWGRCLHQYSLIYSSDSTVSICKVVLDKDSAEASYGLKATCTIQQGTFIKETSSSMSADVFEGLGPSVIQPTPGQLGPQGPRMILGPFRLVNHDCKPNGQIYAISKTNAFCMVAIENIPAGAEITVAYDKTGYYDSSTRCLCKSCRSERGEASPRDLSVLKPGNRGREAEGAKGGPLGLIDKST